MTYDLSPNQVVKQQPKWIRIKANVWISVYNMVNKLVRMLNGQMCRVNECVCVVQRTETHTT